MGPRGIGEEIGWTTEAGRPGSPRTPILPTSLTDYNNEHLSTKTEAPSRNPQCSPMPGKVLISCKDPEPLSPPASPSQEKYWPHAAPFRPLFLIKQAEKKLMRSNKVLHAVLTMHSVPHFISFSHVPRCLDEYETTAGIK